MHWFMGSRILRMKKMAIMKICLLCSGSDKRTMPLVSEYIYIYIYVWACLSHWVVWSYTLSFGKKTCIVREHEEFSNVAINRYKPRDYSDLWGWFTVLPHVFPTSRGVSGGLGGHWRRAEGLGAATWSGCQHFLRYPLVICNAGRYLLGKPQIDMPKKCFLYLLGYIHCNWGWYGIWLQCEYNNNKPPIGEWLIPTIYGDDWGMVYYC